MSDIRPLIAGNWKMNGVAASLQEVAALAAALSESPTNARVALCPPATLIAQMSDAARGSDVLVGGQDCRAEASGAYTGDLSAEMLRDAGAVLVILGHSERRAGHGETDDVVAAKVEAALRTGLEPIICVGETVNEREAGQALAVVTAQVRGSLPQTLRTAAFAVAYEPVWAIGTGLTPTIAQIEEIHMAIRATLQETLGQGGARAPILYGGSVKASNAGEILKAREVGGALVGGASLQAVDFLPIVQAA